MTPAQIRDRYDDELRRRPPDAPGARIERTGSVVRERGTHNNVILSWRFEPGEADAVVGREARYFRDAGQRLEWKRYGHDGPPNLEAVLASHGFVPEETETLLALDLASAFIDNVARSEIEIRRVSDPASLETYARVNERAFGAPPKSSASVLAARIFGEAADTQAFVAYLGGEPAAAGRLELPPERSFAQLWGGGTVAPYRGRGAYRALVAERARIARARGYRFLTVDAKETSRPILERLGFTALTTVCAWNLEP
jgi:GNAT superfamily N-acetyltransferase